MERNRSVGKYRVYVITDEPPIYYPNAYSLYGAESFARIGTQRRKDGSKSEDRAVTRGLKGPLVRVYSDSKRVWPLYAEDVNKLSDENALTESEIPKQLIFKVNGKDRYIGRRLVRKGSRWYVEPKVGYTR